MLVAPRVCIFRSYFGYLVGGFDANECLSEGYWSEATVKEEQTNKGVYMQEGGHIQIVGQGS